VLEVDNFQLHCIDHTSYIDTTIIQMLPAEAVLKAVSTIEGRRGALPPSLRKVIKEAVEAHNALPPDQTTAVVTD
jgi:hypothetical protein